MGNITLIWIYIHTHTFCLTLSTCLSWKHYILLAFLVLLPLLWSNTYTNMTLKISTAHEIILDSFKIGFISGCVVSAAVLFIYFSFSWLQLKIMVLHRLQSWVRTKEETDELFHYPTLNHNIEVFIFLSNIQQYHSCQYFKGYWNVSFYAQLA